MTEQELIVIANNLFRKHWNMDLTIKVSVNPRMYRWSARCYPDKKIEISKFAFDNYEEVGLIDLLTHELTHHACYILKQPWTDGSKFFESEIIRVGASSHSDSWETLLSRGYKKRA